MYYHRHVLNSFVAAGQPIDADMRVWLDFTNSNSYTLSGSDVETLENLISPNESFAVDVAASGTNRGLIATGTNGLDALSISGGTGAVAYQSVFDASRPDLTYDSLVTIVTLYSVTRVTGTGSAYAIQLRKNLALGNEQYNLNTSTSGAGLPTHVSQLFEASTNKSQSFANKFAYSTYDALFGKMNRGSTFYRASHAGGTALSYTDGGTTAIVDSTQIFEGLRITCPMVDDYKIHEIHVYAEDLTTLQQNNLITYFNSKYALSL